MISSQDATSIALDTVIGQIHSNTLQASVQAIVQVSTTAST